MKERDFQATVIALAERFRWRVWHVPTPMRPVGGGRFVPDPRGAGLPDLILMHADPPRLIFAELKNEEGVLSTEQKEFLRLAQGIQSTLLVCPCGSAQCESDLYAGRSVAVYSWRPVHLELIEAVLRSKVSA